MAVPEVFVGKGFNSYMAVSLFISEYEAFYQQKFWKRSSRKIMSTPNIKRHINPELVYYEITYSCIHGGEKFKSRSKGLRKAATFRLGTPCGAYIRLRASPDGHTLDVRAFSEEHNHISVQDRWTVGQVDALIREYRQYPLLYNKNHEDYNNPKLKRECLSKITKALQPDRLCVSEQDVISQWNNLIIRYLNAREQVKSEGNPVLENEPQYWYLQKLDFLREYLSGFDFKSEGFDQPEFYECDVRCQSWQSRDPLASSSEVGVKEEIEEAPPPKKTKDGDDDNLSESGMHKSKNESDIFGEFVAAQLKKIANDERRQDTIFEIHQVLHRALKQN